MTDEPVTTPPITETTQGAKTLEVVYTITPEGGGGPASIGHLIACHGLTPEGKTCDATVGIATGDMDGGGKDWMRRHAVFAHAFAETPWPIAGELELPDTPKGETTVKVTGAPKTISAPETELVDE